MPTALVRDFRQGLKADAHPANLADGATPDCSNVVFDRRTVKVRNGRVLHTLCPYKDPNDYGPRALFEFVPNSGSVRLVAVVYNSVFATTSTDQTFAFNPTAITTVDVTGPPALHPVRAAQLGNALYLVDGTSAVQRLFRTSGTSVETLVSEVVTPTVAPELKFHDVGATDYLLPGEYEFAFSAMGPIAGSSSYVYGPLGPIASISIYGQQESRFIFVTLPAILDSIGEPFVAVYSRNPYSDGEWERVINVSIPSSYIGVAGSGQQGGVNIYAGTTAPVSNYVVTGAVWAAGVATYTIGAHALGIGESVQITGVNPGGYNGYFLVTGVTVNDFSVAMTADPGAWVLGGDVDPNQAVRIDATGLRVLSEPLSYPPSNCSHIINWNNRMVYVGWEFGIYAGPKTTLYISNFGDPASIPIAPYLDAPEDWGTWIVLNTKGQEITALATFGSYLIVWTRSTTWRVEGTGVRSGFRVEQVSANVGCVSQESIASTGNMLIWLSEGTVVAWDGNQMVPLGSSGTDDPIGTLVHEYSQTQRDTAFGAFDPELLQYRITFPVTAGLPDTGVPWPSTFRNAKRNAWVPYRSDMDPLAVTGFHNPSNTEFRRGGTLDRNGNVYAIVYGQLVAGQSWQRVRRVPSTFLAAGDYTWDTLITDYLGQIFDNTWQPTTDPTVDDAANLVYIADTAYSIVCLDLTTGVIQWRYTPNGGNERVYYSPALGDDDIVYFATYRAAGGNSKVYAVDKEGTAIWSRDLGAPGRGSNNNTGPVAYDGEHIYVPGFNGYLSKIDLNGNIVWQQDVSTGIRLTGVNVADPDFIYLYDGSAELFKVSKSTGLNAWGPIGALVHIAEGNAPTLSYDRTRVYCGGNGGANQQLYCRSVTDGAIIWQYKDAGNPNEDFYTPVVDWNGNIVCAATNPAGGVGAAAIYRITSAGTLSQFLEMAGSTASPISVLIGEHQLYHFVYGAISRITCKQTWEPKGETLLFDLREGWWTKFTKQPSGCLLFASKFATPAVYAGDSYGMDESGRVWRLEEGGDDEGWPIVWSWWDRERVNPEGRYKDIVHVRFLLGGNRSANLLTSHIRINEQDTDTTSKVIRPPGLDEPKIVPWRPLPQPQAVSTRVGLTGESFNELELSGLEMMVVDKGEVR